MVSIVLAGHGDFATGVKETAEFLLGPQRDIAIVELKASLGPDDFRQLLRQTTDGLHNKDEVLFLVDLWGGTPFNVVSEVLAQHEGWVAVTGLNAPMLVTAITQLPSAGTAAELARTVALEGRQGVRIRPESLDS